MTTTNRAFIKAYRHDHAEARPAAPIAWSGIRQNAPAPVGDALHASIEYVAIAGREGSASSAFRTTIEDRLPARAWDSISSLEVESPRVAPQTHGPRVDERAPVRRPLSSFSTSKTSREEGPPAVRARAAIPATGAAFQAGTTLASFRWPNVCRSLWNTCPEELRRVGDVLLAESRRSAALVGVVGLFPGQGCTTTLLSLVAPLAARGGRVIVVDGNFGSPQIGGLLGVDADTSWHDVLSRGIPVGDAVVRAVDDNLDVLPYEPHPASDAAGAIGLHASVTAGVLRYAYDLAIVDLGAFFHESEQATMLNVVRSMRLDAAIAVTGPTPDARDLDAVGEHLEHCGCRLLGTIENRAA